jgi:hypothetical protein
MKLLLYPFLVLGAVGFVLSLVVHILSWAEVVLPESLMALHIGIFIVWLPTILVATRLTREYKQKDFWKAALRGAPPWTIKLAIGLGTYVFVHFFASMFLFLPVEKFRIASGHWMVFYGLSAAVLYSALHATEVDRRRKCLNGHPASAVARFCELCGAPVATDST